MANVPSLYKQFEDYFKIGAAINKRTMHHSKDTILKHFNSITAENEMKFENLHPKEDEYTFSISDEMVSFAEQNDIGVRGHTLVWHNQTSEWLFKKDGKDIDSSTLDQRMKSHIETVLDRYKGKMYAWDVVNEVVLDEKEPFLRPSKWLDILGEEFIEKAFIYAHEADPSAQLFYNDYNESAPIKSEKIYQLVKGLKEKEIPVHGIGMQAHWNIVDPQLDDIKRAIEKYASLDVRIHVTEMDVSMFDFEDRRTDLTEPDSKMLELQAQRYEQFFKIFKEYHKHIDSVTLWGVADNYTWLDNFPVRNRKNWPMLFDENHEPKEAFWRIVHL
ncbi:endo-1,4-beta-xylanase [Gracilibacillus halotolerans]|uniref:Beta-xylanase n=1 Tax=Gracilibacillus halotolerans TaxID=74386 RepID=A0A841RK39_9BACI|nr:endo-1,4-beta-xylanase [Gracilibacillus halotolerans]